MKWEQLYSVHVVAPALTLKRLAKLVSEDYDPDVNYIELTFYEGQEREALTQAADLYKAAPGAQITVYSWQSAFSDTGEALLKTRNRRIIKKLGVK